MRSRSGSPARSGRQRGFAVLLTAILLITLIPIVGLVVDGAVAYAVKAKLSLACDAAALAAARSLSRGLTLGEQSASATTRAQAFFDANFPDGYLMTTNKSRIITVAESGYRTRTVTVTGSVKAPVFFMSLLGFGGANVNAVGQASRRDVNLVLVLDHSASMSATSSCGPMRDAASYFVQQFANGRDRLSLITFGNQYYPAYGPGFNFITDTPSLTTLISQIACGSNTNSATAYSEAYKQLQVLNEPGALNVILFFTDGLANGITADWPVKLAQDTQRLGWQTGPGSCTSYSSTCTMEPSPCTWPNSSLTGNASSLVGGGLAKNYQQKWSRDHNNVTYSAGSPNPYWTGAPDPTNIYLTKRGVIAQQGGFGSTGKTSGVFKPLGTSITDTTDDPIDNNTNCQFVSGSYNGNNGTRWDIAYVPTYDVYGNRTDCCFKTVDTYTSGPYQGKMRIDKPSTVGQWSSNALDSAAARVRGDASLGVVTYVIGLGDPRPTNPEPPDDVLMRRVANDPSSPIFDNSKAPGLYVFAPDNTQLQQAFARVASEILRISQ